MSSVSEADADGPAKAAAEPTDKVFLQLKTLYGFFKDPYGTLHRRTIPDEALGRFKAARALNTAIERSPNSFKLFWDELSHDQRERALEVLLKYYCEARADPDLDRRLVRRLFRLELLHLVSCSVADSNLAQVSVDRLRREIGYRRGPKDRRQVRLFPRSRTLSRDRLTVLDRLAAHGPRAGPLQTI